MELNLSLSLSLSLSVCVWICACVCTCVCVCTYVWKYVHVCVCMCVYSVCLCVCSWTWGQHDTHDSHAPTLLHTHTHVSDSNSNNDIQRLCYYTALHSGNEVGLQTLCWHRCPTIISSFIHCSAIMCCVCVCACAMKVNFSILSRHIICVHSATNTTYILYWCVVCIFPFKTNKLTKLYKSFFKL